MVMSLRVRHQRQAVGTKKQPREGPSKFLNCTPCVRVSLASIDAALLSLSPTTAQCPLAPAPLPSYTRVRRSLSSGPACSAVRVGGAACVRRTYCRVAWCRRGPAVGDEVVR